MVPPLSHRVAGCVETASQLYHRLVILAGPPRSGKTARLPQAPRIDGLADGQYQLGAL